MRTFEDSEAVRSRVPLMVGLVGPSFCGKTRSALRLATGIQRVTGGDIYHIDTESRRALQYADRYKFRHMPFEAPFGSLDYLAAVEHAVKRGAKVIIVDSMSHEHEGPGGLLERHAEETKRLAAAWKTSEAKTQMPAWSAPKADRRRMINCLLQLPISAIFCFRAKEKLKIIPGKDPKAMGWMAIAGEEFMYEMALNCFLPPNAMGVPNWHPTEPGEIETIKRPDFLESLVPDGAQLSEGIGEALARWAEGTPTKAPPTYAELSEAIRTAATPTDLASTGKLVTVAQEARSVTQLENNALREAYRLRLAELGGTAVRTHNDEGPSNG